jgi:pulcherriminic acid synthase
MNDADTAIAGANGVTIPAGTHGAAGHRTYEVYQRERAGQSTEKINASALISGAFARDPYPILAILREHYPCYRDWLSNCFWVTRYDDVTSVFADRANYAPRPRRWAYGLESYGRDLSESLPVLFAEATALDQRAVPIADAAVTAFAARGEADLATEFAARVSLELMVAMLDLPAATAGGFVERYWRMRSGAGWEPRARSEGLAAIGELADDLRPLFEQRRQQPGDDLISAVAGMTPADGPPARVEDLIVTLLEMDYETLHGGLANLWYLLLSHPDQLRRVVDERRLLKLAVLETFRHSTPVTAAKVYARHEVERFGRLLPEGALLVCSAAAANRDPRVFAEPDGFVVDRKDLCHREARGQYRADGLATGLTFGLGLPSRHPAVPEDRPRSRYALVRDTIVAVSSVLLDRLDDLALSPGARAGLTSRRLGDMHTCWALPARFRAG